MSDGLDPYDLEPDEEGEEEEEEEEEEFEEETEVVEVIPPVTSIAGVGPKTAEKLAAAGFDTVPKIADATAEKLSELVSGLSLTKAEGIITEAVSILAQSTSGASVSAVSKKSKRKKTTEPEPTRIELPATQVIAKTDEKISLVTGLEKDNAEMGVPIGPKWLTKYERARVVGARALQISMGAPPLIAIEGTPTELFRFAEEELRRGVLPMTVRRTLPTGTHADIPLSVLLKNTRLD